MVAWPRPPTAATNRRKVLTDRELEEQSDDNTRELAAAIENTE